MMLSRSSPLTGRLQRGARLVVSAAAPPFNVGVSSRSFVTARPAAHHPNSSDSGRSLHSGSWNRAAVAAATHTLPPAAAAASPAAAAQQLSSDGLRSCAVALAKVADDTKALDIICLHVEPVVSWTSYMVLCTVMSKPQLLAVLSRMEDAAAEFGLVKQNSAGSSQWEVLDFGSIVCHVFTAEQREYYGLDDFYARAEEVELPFVVTPAAVDEGYGQQYDEGSTIGGLWTKSI